MSGTLVFHYGNFDNHYGDDTRAKSAKNGHIYSDTLTSEIPDEYGTFTMSGTTSGQTTYSWTPTATGQADVLIVAGGGGTREFCGGGGAGGLIYKPNQILNTSSYTIKVGDGGAGTRLTAVDGYNSSAFSYTATGGGRGASSNESITTGYNGGSGGGMGPRNKNPGLGTSGQGNDGGGGRPGYTSGNDGGSGGGGGAGVPGTYGGTRIGGSGGDGIDMSYRFGSKYGDDGWFAGGGAGFGDARGGASTPGKRGKGGGGDSDNGSTGGDNQTAGMSHTGGGAGAGGPGGLGGKKGGSGIVLIGYKYTAKSPVSISGLVGWYTAYSAELSNGSVNKWNDLSGNKNHVESGSFTGSVKRADPNDSTLTNRSGVETDYFGNRTIVFTYGNFSSTFSHTNVESAAKAGVICANTNASEIPPHFGTFTMSGTASGQTTYSWSPPGDCVAEVLVVAGGGGGGGVISGGGGGGGLILRPNVYVKGKDNAIKVGDGGLGATGWNTSRQDGKPGYDSTFESLTAKGGGGGVHHGGATTSTTKDGGSGGGGGNQYSGVGGNTTQSSQSGDSATYGYGHDGGDNGDGNWGSGGGGAGGVGGNTNRSTISGAGGVGKYIDFARNYGDSGWFAGGGSGGTRARGTISNGGNGGGGKGTTTSALAEHGQEYTGGGGGGGGYNGGNSGQIGGNGGSGIVIVKFSLLYGKGPTAFPFLYGTTTDGLRFPTSVMDTSSDYTLFHVARYYKPSGTPTRLRIFDGVTDNWLSGFHSGNSGCAYHDGWLTEQTDSHGNKWVLSTDQKDLYRSNGVDRTISGSGSTSKQLSINYGHHGAERSDWGVAEVIVYDRELSLSEYLSVESYLMSKYFKDDAIASSGELSVMLINNTFYNGKQNITGSAGYPITLGRLGIRIGNTLNALLNFSDFRNLKVYGALDSLSTSLLPTIAFGFRKLLGSYMGPQVRIRRSSDSVEADLYMDSSGTITLISGTTATDYSSWLNGATGYLVTWYDQSGGGRHAVRTRRSTSYTWPLVKKDSGDTTLHMDIQPASSDFVEFDNANLGTHDYTWVMAVQTPSSNSRWRTYLRGQSRHHYLLLQSGGTLVGLYDNSSGGFANTGVNHTLGNKDIYSSYATGGQTVIRHNGNAGNTITKQLSDFWNQRMMLTYPGQGGNKMFEIIFYAGAQSASFVASVEAIVDDVL